MKSRIAFAGLGLMFAMALPNLVAADEVDARVKELRTYLKSCTQKYGYDPKRTRRFGEHEIAPGEAKWRDCAYDGIRKIMVPPSAVPNAYQTLIALDRVMTREIKEGTRTRAEREERIKQFIDRTLAQEKPAPATGATQGKSQQQLDELEKMRAELAARQREITRMRQLQTTIR